MDVAITRASRSDREVVGRLLQLNAYEFSRVDGRAIGSDALYRYPYLDAYWSEPGRFPYLIRADGELAGPALVRRIDADWYVSEFLVLPKLRRAGVGTWAAREVFALHPGSWRVRQVAHNDSRRSSGATRYRCEHGRHRGWGRDHTDIPDLSDY